VVERKARQAAYSLHCSNHFKKSVWRHSAIFKMASEDYPVLLAPSDSMLPPGLYPSREIWLSKAEAWLPSDGLKFYTNGYLFEGKAGFGVFFRSNLISRHLPLLKGFAILACSDYCLREYLIDKTNCMC
jgi:hypothetical protein